MLLPDVRFFELLDPDLLLELLDRDVLVPDVAFEDCPLERDVRVEPEPLLPRDFAPPERDFVPCDRARAPLAADFAPPA